MTKIQGPGSPPPVPAPGATNRRKPNKPNRPNPPNRKDKGKSGPVSPPPGPPPPPAPLNTDQGRIDASNDPQGYFNYLNSAAGFTPGAQGGLFGNWLANDAYNTFSQGFNNARLGGNMDLNVVDYATSLGAPADVANYRAGTLQPLGQAGAASFGTAPVDTGNPYTSSSGTGATPPVTTLPLPGQTLGNKPNKNRHPNQFKRWNQLQNSIGQPASPPPAPTPGGTANLGGYADTLRKQFLSLSPTQRGENSSMWEVPGRWSPWG